MSEKQSVEDRLQNAFDEQRMLKQFIKKAASEIDALEKYQGLLDELDTKVLSALLESRKELAQVYSSLSQETSVG